MNIRMILRVLNIAIRDMFIIIDEIAKSDLHDIGPTKW